MTLDREILKAREQAVSGEAIARAITNGAEIERQEKSRQKLEKGKWDRGLGILGNAINALNFGIKDVPIYQNFVTINKWLEGNESLEKHLGYKLGDFDYDIFYLEWQGTGAYVKQQGKGLVVRSDNGFQNVLLETDKDKGFKMTDIHLEEIGLLRNRIEIGLPVEDGLKKGEDLLINNKAVLRKSPGFTLPNYTGQLVIDGYGGADISLSSVVDLKLLMKVNDWQERYEAAREKVITGGLATTKDSDRFKRQLLPARLRLEKFGENERLMVNKAAQLVKEFGLKKNLQTSSEGLYDVALKQGWPSGGKSPIGPLASLDPDIAEFEENI